jgi:hypothetical protein
VIRAYEKYIGSSMDDWMKGIRVVPGGSVDEYTDVVEHPRC